MTWTDADDARRYGATVLEGRAVRLRALEDDDLPRLVRWWRDPSWAALQQRVVRPLPEAGVAETFRRWSTGEDDGGVGFSVAELRVHAFNRPARAVYLEVGFREEGVRREATFHNGRFHDEVIMSILAREWRPGEDDLGAPTGS